MALSSGRPERRSALTLAVICIVPPVVGGALFSVAYGGTDAAIFGIIFGLLLGVLAVGFALFIGWLSHRV